MGPKGVPSHKRIHHRSHMTCDCTEARRCRCRHHITPGELDTCAAFKASAALFQL